MFPKKITHNKTNRTNGTNMYFCNVSISFKRKINYHKKYRQTKNQTMFLCLSPFADTTPSIISK